MVSAKEEVWRATRPEGGGFWPWEAKMLGAMAETMAPMTAWEVAAATGLAKRTSMNGLRIFRKWAWVERVGSLPAAPGKRRGPYQYELTQLGYRKADDAQDKADRAKGQAGC